MEPKIGTLKLDTVLQDLRFALRGWRRQPRFAGALVGMLALGLAATTVVFALAYAELWAPSPFPHPEQVISIEATAGGIHAGLTAAEYLRLAQAPGLSAVGATECCLDMSLRVGNRAKTVRSAAISPSLLPLLGMAPRLGRNFAPVEAQTGHDGEAIISDAFWRAHFDANPAVLGQRMEFDSRFYTVVGVMPPAFSRSMGNMDVWRPLVFTAAELAQSSGFGRVGAYGRLKPGATWAAVEPRLAAFGRAQHFELRQAPLTYTGVTMSALQHDSPGRNPLLALLGATGLLMLIACTNAAGLLLARSAARQQEMAVRTVLGATRARLVRQLLTEGALLAAVAGSAGLLAAAWAVPLLRSSPLQRELEQLSSARLDGAVVAFAVAAVVACALIASLAPALRLSAKPRASARQRARGMFLVFEVALTVTLLVGAGLVADSLFRLYTNATGVDAGQLAVAELQFTPAQERHPEQVALVAGRALAAVAHAPGWTQVTLASAPPFGDDFFRMFRMPGGAGLLDAADREVAPGYFSTVGQRLVMGRAFSAGDDAAAPGVVIVNQSWVKRFAPGSAASPLGMQLLWANRGEKTPVAHTVVGVVSDARDMAPDLASEPEVYLPYAQGRSSFAALIVRSKRPAAAAVALERALARDAPEATIAEAQPLSYFFSDDIALPRFQSLALIAFAGLALIFALSGIWALVAYAVEQRRREFGIRLALGAPPGAVLRLALQQFMALTAMGIALGLAGAWAVTRFLRALLFQVQTLDARTFAAVTVAFALVALGAAYVPARRALDADPAATLRSE
ncbi:MAG: ADOP family duplicated permease [Terriglobales bacterium]